MKVRTKSEARRRRHLRLRQKVSGTADRPRMAVYCSNTALYVQFIDDVAGHTLAAASTRSAAMAEWAGQQNQAAAKQLGAVAAAAALAAGIEAVVFDRGGFTYGARLRALADGVRAGGLKL
ncbi:MAG: 50S ribosomal protein L18 [Candidatus Marinimicrobia bacterium]|nr:50S ribosomal protein L18 [Candidatus Neomarinimicrobiota bacterium]